MTPYKLISALLIIILVTKVSFLAYFWTQGNNDLASMINIITYSALAIFVFLALKK